MSPHPLSVLLVDDSDLLRSLMSHYLDAESDLQVIASVSNAGDAVAHVRDTAAPDVILLDHDMPGLQGLDVLPELRARCPHARIVMFSSAVELRSRALATGADEFVPKERPFHEVAEALRGWSVG